MKMVFLPRGRRQERAKENEENKSEEEDSKNFLKMTVLFKI